MEVTLIVMNFLSTFAIDFTVFIFGNNFSRLKQNKKFANEHLNVCVKEVKSGGLFTFMATKMQTFKI